MEIIRTSKNRKEKIQKIALEDLLSHKQSEHYLIVNLSQEKQRFIGFGGALTRSVQINYNLLSQEQKKELLEAYFSPKGLNYRIGRVHISSCDFGDKQYDYYAKDSHDISTFTLDEERMLLSLLQDIRTIQPHFMLYATPWSPSSWMKTNNDRCHGGKLLPEYVDEWANYIATYLEKMEETNNHIDFLSVQNEPEAIQKWDSLEVTAIEEGDFIKNHLRKYLMEKKLDPQICIWEHNKDHAYIRAKTTLNDKSVNQLVGAVSYHWYVSNDFDSLDKIHNDFPNKHIYFTEGCVELTLTYNKKSISDYHNGEVYGYNIIEGFNHYTEMFLDWNILLDERGGPTYVDNFCEAPILFDTRNKKLIYNTSYYYLYHFAHFIKPDSVILNTITKLPNHVYAIATKSKENLVIVLQNENTEDCIINLSLENKPMNINLLGNSIVTISLNKEELIGLNK